MGSDTPSAARPALREATSTPVRAASAARRPSLAPVSVLRPGVGLWAGAAELGAGVAVRAATAKVSPAKPAVAVVALVARGAEGFHARAGAGAR